MIDIGRVNWAKTPPGGGRALVSVIELEVLLTNDADVILISTCNQLEFLSSFGVWRPNTLLWTNIVVRLLE